MKPWSEAPAENEAPVKQQGITVIPTDVIPSGDVIPAPSGSKGICVRRDRRGQRLRSTELLP